MKLLALRPQNQQCCDWFCCTPHQSGEPVDPGQAREDLLGVRLLIEPINLRDMTDYFLNRQDHAPSWPPPRPDWAG